MPSIDHLLWAVPDLEQGIDHFERLTGVRPVFGGAHPGRGTHNALASLGGGQYIELIAPDPAQDASTRQTGLAAAVAAVREPALLTFVIAYPELEALGAAAARAGIAFRGPVAASRVQPDGSVLRWRLGHTDATPFGLGVPFYIDWQDSVHPSTSAPGGLSLQSFEVLHPEADALRTLFGTLGFAVGVRHGEQASLRAVLDTPLGEVALAGPL